MAADPTSLTDLKADDCVIVFRTVKSNVRGRIVRLGKTLDAVVSPHAMPEVAGRALSEALALAALCGSALPDGGNLNLQTRSDGPVSILVADYAAAGRLRGYARYDAEALGQSGKSGGVIDPGPKDNGILGDGHLAITLDAGPGSERYQGVLAFERTALAETVAAYFQQREVMPTFVRLAVGKQFFGATKAGSGATPEPSGWHMRAGGLMMQSLAANDSDADSAAGEDWRRVEMLAATVEDHELLDPDLTSDRLLLRLFHEEAVRVERVIPLTAFCRCSRDKVENVLLAFGAGELSDMRDDNGQIVVTCEFCTAKYAFALEDLKAQGNQSE
ncbi:molecular chaperone Hsp33 [Hyphomicrobium methylovorum]|uniref:Hsp33 family molecular chaperone HslO n=1 Tax=Hyphomicrobium methylovorum TaxID=84 RepID=UPI0015E7DB65|nr:Hsp33 family molecular chaperone HslO [Hyphomicrobium methylovorum]MBA2126460.1 molecular chaperone Hsp33 [Hyphomicrobium methylovorum]